MRHERIAKHESSESNFINASLNYTNSPYSHEESAYHEKFSSLSTFNSLQEKNPLSGENTDQSKNYQQRTPGQILSLTSSIKFSDSLNYESSSPEYGRKLGAQDVSNLNLFKLKNQKPLSNACKPMHANNMQQNQLRFCPRHSKAIEDSMKLDATTNSSKIQKNLLIDVMQ